MPFSSRSLARLNSFTRSFNISWTVAPRSPRRSRFPVRFRIREESISHRNFSSLNRKPKPVMMDPQSEASRPEIKHGVTEDGQSPSSTGPSKPLDNARMKKAPEPPSLPPLSAADFKALNYMAEHMDQFHNSFRNTWTILHKACTTNQRPANLTLRQFLHTGLQFIHHLDTHHTIEETYVFPRLATRMPEFRNTAELLRQHAEIHKGMDGMRVYLEECKSGERELVLRELGEKMDAWETVLWTHLDEEVKTLGAENMRRYWSKEEVQRMLM